MFKGPGTEGKMFEQSEWKIYFARLNYKAILTYSDMLFVILLLWNVWQNHSW